MRFQIIRSLYPENVSRFRYSSSLKWYSVGRIHLASTFFSCLDTRKEGKRKSRPLPRPGKLAGYMIGEVQICAMYQANFPASAEACAKTNDYSISQQSNTSTDKRPKRLNNSTGRSPQRINRIASHAAMPSTRARKAYPPPISAR